MRAVVRAHLIEQVPHLLVRQRVEQAALLRRREIRKRPRRLLSRKQAEDYPLRRGRLLDDDVRDVRGVHRPQRVPQLVPLSPCYQFPDRITCLDHAAHGRSALGWRICGNDWVRATLGRSEEHTSELQSRLHLVCRLLLEKKKKRQSTPGRRESTPRIPKPAHA